MTTVAILGTDVAARISEALPGAVLEATSYSVTVPAGRVAEVALFLRDDEELDCKYLNCLTAIDWLEHFDIVYVLSSLAKNHSLVLEARVNHEDAILPSVTPIWQGAELQEREAYDLMGVSFAGHPNHKRIFLWDGFPGHPLRKDFLALPQGHRPGLQRFPFEFPAGQRSYPSLGADEGPRAPAVPRLTAPLAGQAAARPLSGGQLAVRGGGATHTRAPGGVEPAPAANQGGSGNPPAEREATGGRTPLSNAEDEAQPVGGSGYEGPADEDVSKDDESGEQA